MSSLHLDVPLFPSHLERIPHWSCLISPFRTSILSEMQCTKITKTHVNSAFNPFIRTCNWSNWAATARIACWWLLMVCTMTCGDDAWESEEREATTRFSCCDEIRDQLGLGTRTWAYRDSLFVSRHSFLHRISNLGEESATNQRLLICTILTREGIPCKLLAWFVPFCLRLTYICPRSP